MRSLVRFQLAPPRDLRRRHRLVVGRQSGDGKIDSVVPVRRSSSRSASRSSTKSETSAAPPPTPAATPSEASTIAPSAIADRAAADHAVDHRDDGREGEELRAPLGRYGSVLEHPSAVVVAGEQEELRLVAGDLLVVVADPVDGDAVAEVLGAALDHSHEGEDTEDVERREHGEGEDVERRADLRRLADEPQRDQGARDGEDVERRARGALGRGLRTGALEREVLRGQRGQELLAIRGLRHPVKVPRTPDPATGRAQCGRADPGWCLTVRVEPLTLEWIEALVEGDGVFAARFGIPVEAGWEGFPEALRPTLEDVRRNGADPWGSHLFFDDDGTLVGFGGFKGPPRDGEVEIGYAVAPPRQGRGLATAAATALVERARGRTRRHRRRAHPCRGERVVRRAASVRFPPRRHRPRPRRRRGRRGLALGAHPDGMSPAGMSLTGKCLTGDVQVAALRAVTIAGFRKVQGRTCPSPPTTPHSGGARSCNAPAWSPAVPPSAPWRRERCRRPRR